MIGGAIIIILLVGVIVNTLYEMLVVEPREKDKEVALMKKQISKTGGE